MLPPKKVKKTRGCGYLNFQRLRTGNDSSRANLSFWKSNVNQKFEINVMLMMAVVKMGAEIILKKMLVVPLGTGKLLILSQ